MPAVRDRSGRARRALACLLGVSWLAAVGACGEGGSTPTPVEPPPPAVASVEIAPAGALALETGQSRVLEVAVRDQAGRLLSGRRAEWQSSAPAVASLAVAGSGAAATLVAIAPGTAVVTVTSEGRSASANVVVTVPPAFDASIVDAQWTQAAQAPDGSIPLVLGGNAAVLNVLLESTRAASRPGPLVLSLRDEADALVHADTLDLVALDGGGGWATPSAQFLVPSAILRPGLRWRVRRDPARTLVDADSTNDVFPRGGPAPLRVVSLPTMRLRFIPLTLAAHGNTTGQVTAGNLEEYLRTFRRVFPMGALEAVVGPPLVTGAVFGAPPSGGAAGFWVQALLELDLARVAQVGADDEYWMGVVRPPPGFTFTSFGGFAYIPVDPRASGPGSRSATVVQTGWFTNTGQTADLVVHETSHLLGRRHAPCGGATGVDPAFPFAGGTIGLVGHDVFSWATGAASRAASVSATTGDVMGYCFPQWVSPYSYSAMLEARRATMAGQAPRLAGVTAASPAAGRPRVRERVAVVRGVFEQGEIRLLPTVLIDGAATADQDGALTVRLRDGQGRVIAARRAALRETDHGEARTFTVAVPLGSEDAEQLAAIEVVDANGRTARQRRRLTDAIVGAPRVDRAATALGAGATTLRCADPAAAAIVVQDAETGRVLAAVSAASVSLPYVAATRVEVSCSDGVRSTRALLTPRSLLPALLPALPGR